MQQVQSQHALGVKWAGLEQRNLDGNPIGSAIRTAWNRHSKLQQKFLDIIREELAKAFAKGPDVHGWYSYLKVHELWLTLDLRRI